MIEIGKPTYLGGGLTSLPIKFSYTREVDLNEVELVATLVEPEERDMMSRNYNYYNNKEPVTGG